MENEVNHYTAFLDTSLSSQRKATSVLNAHLTRLAVERFGEVRWSHPGVVCFTSPFSLNAMGKFFTFFVNAKIRLSSCLKSAE